jgi:hypothetical protein
MTDGWRPRTALILMPWTLLLLGLVLVEIRHLPPVLAALLVPYLALMAWHGAAGLRRRTVIGQMEPHEGGSQSRSDDGADDEADSPVTAGLSGTGAIPVPDPSPPSDGQTLPMPPRRGRARRRPPTPEPSSASWVQVQPGRFLRVEEPSPPDQPDDSPPPDPEATQGAVLTPEVSDPEAAEPEALHEPAQINSDPEDQEAGAGKPGDDPDLRPDAAQGDPAGELSSPGQAPET